MRTARLDAFELATHLQERLVNLTVSEHYLRNPALLDIARHIWSSGREGLLSELWVEGSIPPRSSGQRLQDLVDDGCFPAELARQLDHKERVPSGRMLHLHQAQAIQAAPAQDGPQPTLMITAGTGAGKTESFLLPLLNHLWARPRSGPGVRAIILYPMNALVNDQLDRLDRWLRGQDRVRLCRFTSETPEDRAAAQARGLKLGSGHRLHTRAQARGLEDAAGRPVTGERLSPPDILITNYSMLEYMLARPQDQVLFGAGLQTLVLDEAHLYTGTLAAELALLLRRLFLRCRREPEDILALATSATIGGGASDELVQFGATLFSRDPAGVKVIRGQDAETSLPAPEPPEHEGALSALADRASRCATIRQDGAGREVLVHDPEAVERLASVLERLVHRRVVQRAMQACEGFPARLLQAALPSALLVQRLAQTLRERRYQDLSSLSQTLFQSHDDASRRATTGLLSLVAAARESVDDMPLLPHRLHLLFRPSANLAMCLHDQCPGRALQLQETDANPADDPLPWGPLLASEAADCPHCQGPTLTLVRCTNCGQEALASGSPSKAVPLRGGQRLRDVPRVQATGGNKQPSLWGRPGQGERDWSLAGEAHVFTPGQGHYEIGLKLAQQATNQLALGHQKMVEHIEAMGRVSCMFCGRENDRGQAKCGQCGRALPQDAPTSSFEARESAGLDPASKGQVTENYKQLAAATEAWRAEQLDADGLLAKLEEVEDRLTRHQGDNLKYRETLENCPEEHRTALYNAVDATDKALDAGLLALEKMKLAFEKEDDSYLESGLHDFEASAWMMLAALSTMQAAVSAAEAA